MKQLICTADDFGPIKSINNGIIEAVELGYINSVDVLSNYNKEKLKRDVSELLEKASAAGKTIELGGHLSVLCGKPILGSKVRSLRDRNGAAEDFMTVDKFRRQPVKVNELRAELMAQVQAIHDAGFGDYLTHLSNHFGVLNTFPEFMQVYLDVARAYDLAIRSPVTKPGWRSNLYSIGLPILFKALDKDDIKLGRHFLKPKQLKDTMATMGGDDVLIPSTADLTRLVAKPALRTPFYNDVRHYAKFDGKEANDKNRVKRIIRNVTTDEPQVEAMFHLRKRIAGKETQRDYKAEAQKANYVGVEPSYFAKRAQELDALKRSNFERLLQTKNVTLSSWKAVKSNYD